MDTPDNYYTLLGIPPDADNDSLKRAYRQLARRYHPDLAGPDGALQMKRINRAYDVLSDSEKRLQYDTLLGGSIDLRKGGLMRPRPVARKFTPEEEAEFAGLSIFSTRGPLRTGERLHSGLGVLSALTSMETSTGPIIAAGSLDGKGLIWRGEDKRKPVSFTINTTHLLESLRELRFSPTGSLLAGWGRLSLHVWSATDGTLQWTYPLEQRAVSAHYSLDMIFKERENGAADLWMALPLQLKDPLAPRVHGVRGTDVVSHTPEMPIQALSTPLRCAESEVEKRRFWAIRLRALSQNLQTLCTLSCANVADEDEQMIVLRRWDLTSTTRFGHKPRPQVSSTIIAGPCTTCSPPYTITPDTNTLAFVCAEKTLRLHDTWTGLYSEVPCGSMGASSRLAISPDGVWVAVAREDSEINEGVVDLWSAANSQLLQRLYHPWQVSALHFAGKRLLVALTDGTIQVWN